TSSTSRVPGSSSKAISCAIAEWRCRAWPAWRAAPYNGAMHESSTLSNQLLIAMPNLHDPNFERGVAIICQHGEDGTMGIMVNRLSDYSLGDVLAQMSLRSDLPEVADAPVLIGG